MRAKRRHLDPIPITESSVNILRKTLPSIKRLIFWTSSPLRKNTQLAQVSLSMSAQNTFHDCYAEPSVSSKKSRREEDEEKERRRILPVSRRSPRRRRRLSRRSEILDLGSGQTIRPDAWNGDRASETGKARLRRREESLAERYPGSCKPAGESSRRARDRGQLAPLLPLLRPSTIKRHQHRSRSRLLRCRNRVPSSEFSADAISDTRSKLGSAGSRCRGGGGKAVAAAIWGRMEWRRSGNWRSGGRRLYQCSRSEIVSVDTPPSRSTASTASGRNWASHARLSVVGHTIYHWRTSAAQVARRVQRGRISVEMDD